MDTAKNTFCTIITRDYLPYAKTILSSLQRFDSQVRLHVLIVGENVTLKHSGLFVHTLNEVTNNVAIGDRIVLKYNNENSKDQLRWSLKPVFINFLFSQGYEKVIFTDPDTYYFSDFGFLFDELNCQGILLSPHWRGKSPTMDHVNFDLQFVEGLYNAGFVGVHKNSKDAMDWWAKCCLHRCEKSQTLGHYVDQTYLNLLPIYFDNVSVLKHQGCNVAGWNISYCKRVKENDTAKINNQWPVVFIHFADLTISMMVQGQDDFLVPYLHEYISELSKNGVDLDLKHFERKKPSLYRKIEFQIKKAFNKT